MYHRYSIVHIQNLHMFVYKYDKFISNGSRYRYSMDIIFDIIYSTISMSVTDIVNCYI